MKLSLPALREALAKHFSPEMDGAFGAALAIHLGGEIPDSLDVSTVSAVLVQAMLRDAPAGVENTPLRCVELTFNGTVITFDPGEASTHPLLRDWTPPTLAAAVSQIILAGAALTSLAAGAPVFGDIWFREVAPGEIAAGAALTFRTQAEAQAQLVFGIPPIRKGFMTIREVTGDALFALGMESITPPIASHALEQQATMNSAADAATAGAMVEAQTAATFH